MNKTCWTLLITTLVFGASTGATSLIAKEIDVDAEVNHQQPMNVVVIFCDDLGYGDLSCFGNPTIKTPELDRMASEGMKLTQFYSAAPVCTPSRAALMTGRLPLRNGMCSNKRRVLFPNSKGGIQPEEVTVAELLKGQGYSTGCVGKWHLGHLPQYLPTQHGFDYYYGIPYSNDMDRIASAPAGRASFNDPKSEYWNVPLIENDKEIERPTDQTTITRRYTEKATQFIKDNKDGPFFLYLAHSMPHVPLFASKDFEGRSDRGLFGDVIEEVDWSVGQVLQTLRDLEIDSNTLVLFTSDNGPWLTFGDHGGSAGMLRDGKGSTWEGGMREPTLAWCPGKVPAATINSSLASTMDVMATCAKISGGKIPQDRVLDSYDLSSVLFENGASDREAIYYYRAYNLMAVRKGPWKMHLMTQAGYGQGSGSPVTPETPLLFHLGRDPGEQRDVAKNHPEVIEELKAVVAEHRKTMEPAKSQLEY